MGGPAGAASAAGGSGPVGHPATSLAFTHANYHAVKACASASRPGFATCLAQRLVPDKGTHVRRTAATGLTPSDIQSAYNLSGRSAGGRTVAIVDAYGYPKAASDLATYRANYGLPACTTSNGCLSIVDQNGGGNLPPTDIGWDQEQALDLDAVSAACPSCHILLVQADSPSFANLGTAVDTAASKPGVAAISNSYGGGDAADSAYGAYYNHPGVAVTASSGDNGYQGASFPASSHYVTGIGGTTLVADSSARGWGETVWSGSGSGCTTLNAAPAGQTYAMTHCNGRAMADVSADADPASGLIIYGPTSSGASAWQQFGGTSLASPIVASVYALSGNTAGYANTIPYANPGGLNDVTSGRNGSCSYWCAAGSGWDGPTGLGTPIGTSAF
ncbi:MAG: S53 family peptidase [Nocardioidaceae bacterium]